jgi:hypothetical protein
MNALLEKPPVLDPKAQLRDSVALDLLRGRSEDYVYMRQIDAAIESARLVGIDESDVDVIVAGVRRDVASILNELRSEGLHSEP